MKYLKIILLTTLVVLGACKKDKEDIGEDLSYIDKYCKGSVSFTLDGKEYTKKFKSDKKGISLMLDENFALYRAKYSDGFPNTIDIKVALEDPEEYLNISISSPNKFEVAKFPSILDFDKKASDIRYYQEVGGSEVLYNTSLSEKDGDSFVNVTKYDFDKRILEGEFEAKLMKFNSNDENELKYIKKGKFSVIFTNY